MNSGCYSEHYSESYLESNAGLQTSVAAGQVLCKEMADEVSAQEWMSQFYAPHSLTADKPKKMCFSHTYMPVYSRAASVGYVEYGTDVVLDIDDIIDCYSISLPIQGSQELTQLGEVAYSDQQQAVIISPSSPASLQISGDCKKRMVRISREALEQQLAILLQRPVDEPIVFDIQMNAVAGKSASWWRTVLHLQEELGSTDSVYVGGAFLQELERTLLTGLLASQAHNYSSVLNNQLKITIPTCVQRAETFIRENMQQVITLEDVVDSAQVSQKALYSNFKRYYGISPMAFLRNLRMDSVHQDLLTAGANENITGIALKWGFNHLGRFSLEYKKRFGESPSQTRKSHLARRV